MGQAASPSLYDFASGDPVNFFDPDGRFGGTPLTAGEYFSAVGSGLFTGAANVGNAVVTAPGRLISTVASGYQQIGGFAADAANGSLYSDLSLMSSHPIDTAQVFVGVEASMAVQIGSGVVQQAKTSQGLANLSSDLGLGLLLGDAGVNSSYEGAPNSYFWTGPGTKQAAARLVDLNGGQLLNLPEGTPSSAITSGSVDYANAARGDVYVVQMDGVPPRLQSTFVSDEYPAILNNTNVPNIRFISVDQAGNVVDMTTVPNEAAQLAYLRTLTAFVTGDIIAPYSQGPCPSK
jgi:hypothetical protein